MNQRTYRNLWKGVRIFGDCLVFLLSFFTVYFLREHYFIKNLLGNNLFLSSYLLQLPFLFFIFLLIFKIFGLYDEIFYTRKLREIYLIFRSLLWWILFLVLYFYIFHISFSRMIFFVWVPFLFLFLVCTRLLIKTFQAKMVRRYEFKTRIGIVGSEEKVKNFLEILKEYPYLGVDIVFCHTYKPEGIKNLHKKEAEKIISEIEKSKVDEIFITDECLTYDTILDLIYKVSNKKLIFRISTDIFKLATGKFDESSLGEIPVLDLHKSTLSFAHIVLKRVVDVVFGFLFLVLFSLPILLICLIIKVSSPGPVFLKQERVGYKGKRFFMYKFRTMDVNTPLYEKSPTDKKDKRITPFGRILRKTSMDELPQFFNVLKGEMSIVGPRPEMPFLVENYKPWQMKRLEAKPGITGLWQILGRKDIVLADNLEYDFYYINNQSILFDFIILAKTVPVVFLGKGAY
ncbi:MAG: sugar transferase [Candidatus Nomurabacteria bacterium]|nr:sugar transferase [Candidatus Nomurabacteria bacterium]